MIFFFIFFFYINLHKIQANSFLLKKWTNFCKFSLKIFIFCGSLSFFFWITYWAPKAYAIASLWGEHMLHDTPPLKLIRVNQLFSCVSSSFNAPYKKAYKKEGGWCLPLFRIHCYQRTIILCFFCWQQEKLLAC